MSIALVAYDFHYRSVVLSVLIFDFFFKVCVPVSFDEDTMAERKECKILGFYGSGGPYFSLMM